MIQEHAQYDEEDRPMLGFPAVLLEREGASAPFLFQDWAFFAVKGVKLSSIALVDPVSQDYL